MLAEPVRIALAVGEMFDRLGVGWVVGGSVASSVHGLPRATQDIDLVADLQPQHAAPLAHALRQDFYADVDAIAEAIRRRSSFNVIHLDSMTKVDVFVPRGDRLAQAQIARRQLVAVGEGTPERLPVLSAEDVILQKLRWFDSGGRTSERQWRDVLGVIGVRRTTLDLEYLREQAGEGRLADLLHMALDEAPGAAR